MASTFITITLNDQNARFATDLKRASELMRQLMDTLDGIVDRGYLFIGDPATFGDFEEAYGLPAGTGQTVFDIVNGVNLALNGTAQNAQAIALRDRVG